MATLSSRFVPVLLMAIAFGTTSSSPLWAQFGGSRAGVESATIEVPGLPMLNREVVEGFIAVDGRAEVRVRPTEMRIVLAVTSEGDTAEACHTQIETTIAQLRGSWTSLGIPEENIVEDFIAVLPMYQWELEKKGSQEIGIEKKSGYRMQVNVHLAVPNDDNAVKAFTTAFKHGVTDIIAFDYWSKELDEVKQKARGQAVKAARSKADVLLGALFDTPPRPINVQEKTTVHYPESLYDSFVNSHDEEFSSGWRRDTPYIRAHRPRNTYYRGLYTDGDVQAKELPMHPEISVVSTVRLYFRSGAVVGQSDPASQAH